jgi:hypothetical protein
LVKKSKRGVDKTPLSWYNTDNKREEPRAMKKLFRYIRHRICRSIYYADYCPIDNRKNYRQMFENFIAALGLTLSGLVVLILFCLMGF